MDGTRGDDVVRISVTGDLGSGKSTVCKDLQSKWSFAMFSSGNLQRQIAEKLGMSTYELNQFAETHPEIDDEIDQTLMDLSHCTQDIIIDSRLAWHFVQDTFKVYLSADRWLAAMRIHGHYRGSSERYTDVANAVRQLDLRKRCENARYLAKYGVDCSRLSNYHCVIDTSFVTPGEVADLILDRYHNWESGDKSLHIFLSPLRLYPTIDARTLSASLIAQCDGSETIDILFANDDFYIRRGHHAAAAFIKRGTHMASCYLVAQDDERIGAGLTARRYVRQSCDPSRIREWEIFNGINFLSGPKCVGRKL
ncbi:MAG: cytidylate kinase family protein [Oscillospiraceae bacterium]|nr:cytidylate kinase family protein [Oscillospiraceae bacterium]